MTTLITEGLFRVDGDGAVLFASRRRSSGVAKFPAERPELFDGDPEIQDDIEHGAPGAAHQLGFIRG